jgi:hypothetical protein
MPPHSEKPPPSVLPLWSSIPLAVQWVEGGSRSGKARERRKGWRVRAATTEIRPVLSRKGGALAQGLEQLERSRLHSRRIPAVTRRCPMIPAVTIAATLVLAGWSAPARADHLATYQLTTTTGLSSAGPDANHLTVTGPQVIANVIPVGAVVAPVVDGKEQTPVQILLTPPYPPSNGFDQNNLVASLSPTDASAQYVGFSFANGGLAKNGNLFFGLNISDTVPGSPQVVSQTPGVNIQPFQLTPSAETPEPLSLVLWSTVVGASVWRARSRHERPIPRTPCASHPCDAATGPAPGPSRGRCPDLSSRDLVLGGISCSIPRALSVPLALGNRVTGRPR